ncbi:hypothetical protein NEFER03_1426 [Nematocida sp. LUAm3]|nr:hypothetical protein NEFER03_1426 [Nematocida sp. LUAm3]KAI5174744.1 hypothetical protein NEFER02_0854 [Nematocida sp. LUAm2]KAI5177845.1 hypothetical protein NEFER01_1047 [Nematocida sp. LUAm1]
MTYIYGETNQCTSIEYTTMFSHNSVVHGVEKHKEFLFTLTEHYLYIWNYSSKHLLFMIKAHNQNTSIIEDPSNIQGESAITEAKKIEEYLAEKDIYIFCTKKYLRLHSTLLFSIYHQNDFIPSTRSTTAYIAAENKHDLYAYSKERKYLGTLPKIYGICTSLKWQDPFLYASFESGHILKVDISVHPISTSIHYYSSPFPILDFLPSPITISYFNKSLITMNPHTITLQRNIELTSMHRLRNTKNPHLEHSLFIALSRYRILLLTEHLEILAEKKEKVEALFPAEESIFLCRDTGVLVEVQTNSN